MRIAAGKLCRNLCRRIIIYIQDKQGVSQSRVCIVLGQTRKTQRRNPFVKDEELRLTERIIALATQYDRKVGQSRQYRKSLILLNPRDRESQMTKRINHIGIAAKSISEMLKLYTDVLGLKLKDIEVIEEQKMKTAIIRVGERMVELLESTDPESHM